VVQASLGKKQDCISKIIRAKRAVGVAQAVTHLPSQKEALLSNPTTTKKRKENQKQRLAGKD
jgi:hypothetical protein